MGEAMKMFFGYFVFGLLLYGLALGDRINKCPEDDYTINWEPVIVGLSWPVTLPLSFIVNKDILNKPIVCKVKQ